MDARRLAVISLALNAVTLALLVVMLSRPEPTAFDDSSYRADVREVAEQLDTLERQVKALSTSLAEAEVAIGSAQKSVDSLADLVDDGMAGLEASLDEIGSDVGQLCDLTDGCFNLP